MRKIQNTKKNKKLYQNPHRTYKKKTLTNIASCHIKQHPPPTFGCSHTSPKQQCQEPKQQQTTFEKQTLEATTTTFVTTTNPRLAHHHHHLTPPSLPPQFKSATTKTTMSHHDHATTVETKSLFDVLKITNILYLFNLVIY